VDTEAEVLAVPEGQQPFDGPVPDELVRVGVLPFVTGRRCQQRDDPLPGPQRGVVEGVGPPDRSGEPLGGRAVPDDLLARDGDIAPEVGAHGRQLFGSLRELPQPGRGDLGDRLGPADEDTEHLCGRLEVGELRSVRQPEADQAVGDRHGAVGTGGPAPLDDRRQVGQVPGARVSDLDTLAGLRQAARVDRREHIGCEIDREADEFAHQ